MSIKPIETKYKGYRFRSRLEARWAVFFDECGFDWEYEPEGFDIDGVKYLPDFRLNNIDRRAWNDLDLARPFYVEVKGVLDADSLHKIDNMAKYYPIYVVNGIPYGESITDYFMEINNCFNLNSGYYDFFSFYYVDADNYSAGLFVNKKGQPCLVGPDHDYDDIDWEKTKKALLKARCARFEHGECG